MHLCDERMLTGVGSTELTDLHASLLARVRNRQARAKQAFADTAT